ncbi:MAG: hypothetical protein M1539_07045 [Actinobacteria bacterium]|nr:hypothetical protein [Actinomycetota bacterium]MCL5883708.1 hypothetical protein [Actinomycetota bacterium]
MGYFSGWKALYRQGNAGRYPHGLISAALGKDDVIREGFFYRESREYRQKAAARSRHGFHVPGRVCPYIRMRRQGERGCLRPAIFTPDVKRWRQYLGAAIAIQFFLLAPALWNSGLHQKISRMLLSLVLVPLL